MAPWWVKMAGHLFISNLLGGYPLWHRLGILQHGRMDDPSYAYPVFMKHFDRVRPALPPEGFTGLELGPGDSISSALIARALGTSRYYLVDDGNFARQDVDHYQRMASYLAKNGLRPPSLAGLRTLKDVLTACQATYDGRGLAALADIPSGSLDFVWSHGVLPNIRRDQFLDYLHELRRILKPSGLSSHVVPLNDQFVGSLHHLTVPSWLWESAAMARCGPYTNRLRYSEMLRAFHQAGFEMHLVTLQQWERLPVSRSRLDTPFREMTDAELRVFGFDVVLRPTSKRPDPEDTAQGCPMERPASVQSSEESSRQS